MAKTTAKRRSNRGNMIVFATAIIVGIVVSLLAFGYNYIHLLGGRQGQETAIQAAALTAAQDLSRMVVDSPEIGFVGFSDVAPIGSTTILPDQWKTQVRGINTLIGTARVEYIIGQKLNDPTMKAFADHDFTVLSTKVIPELKAAANAALANGGTAKDVDGNTITVYDNAENAFKTNLKKTASGAVANYVSKSLKMTLGCLTAGNGIATNIPVPHSSKAAYAAPTTTPQVAGNYVSEVDMQLDATHFAFGSIGASPRLVDHTLFTLDNGNTVQVPAVIKVEADQAISDSQKAAMKVHAIAAAAPANVLDPRPAPGALTIAFPDGTLPEIVNLDDLRTSGNMTSLMVDTTNNSPKAKTPFANLCTPSPGDYPKDAGSLMNGMDWPLGSATPTMAQVWMCAFYDWCKRAGAKADIGTICTQFYANFTPTNPGGTKHWITLTEESTSPVDITDLAPGLPIPVGHAYTFKFNADGSITPVHTVINPLPLNVLAEKQMYAEGVNAVNSSIGLQQYPSTAGLKLSNMLKVKGTNLTGATLYFTNRFDVYIRDECRNYGKTTGGKHGGEPLDDPSVAALLKPSTICLNGKKGSIKYSDLGSGGVGCKTGGGGEGAIPLLSIQSDFSEPLPGSPPLPAKYTTGMYDEYSTGNGSMRPTYETTGSAIEVRFRRQIKVGADVPDPSGTTGSIALDDTGYLFIEK